VATPCIESAPATAEKPRDLPASPNLISTPPPRRYRRRVREGLNMSGVSDAGVGDVFDDATPSTMGDLLAAIAAGSSRCADGWALALGDVQALASMTIGELSATLACTRAMARRLRLAFDLHRRLLTPPRVDRPSLRAPEDVAAVMRPHVLLDHERLFLLPLDSHCRLIGDAPILLTQGDVDGVDAGPRVVARAAVRVGAVQMVVLHNHPAGDPSPSAADVAVTRRLVAAGRAVDVPLVDHLVICADGRFASIRREHPDAFR
jgi:DNA repair protein RadC